MSALFVLAVFLIFAALMYTRRMPALLAVPAMAAAMAFVAGVPAAGVGTIVVTGATALAKVYVTVIVGAMLARVTMDTGIAKSIVNFAAEFGGEQPVVVALLLSAVVALLFVTLSGLGAIIMVGSIVLPIMMTTGVPRKIAATMFLMAFALGYIFSPVAWTFYTRLFGVHQQQMYGYAVVLAAVDAAALLIYTAVSFRTMRAYATWAVPAEEPVARGVPWFALVTPILPIVLYFVLQLDPIVAFIVSAVYGAVTTKPARAVQTLAAAVIRGVEDVAPAIVLFVGIGMLFTATQQPQFVAAMHPLATGALRNPVVFVVIFGLLSPLVLYRGPLNPYGVGIAIFTVLLSAHVLPPIVLVAAIMAVVQVQNVCDPTNTQNVWVANFTGVPIDEITKRTLPYQVAVATIACIVVAAAAPSLLGVRGFAALVARAQAAQTDSISGMFVGPRAAYRIAAGQDGSADAHVALGAAIRALNTAPVRAFALRDDPNSGDCAGKRYAAYVTLTSTRFALIEGTDVDVGVKLSDCGGWDVGEWHDHGVFAQPSAADAENLAVQGITRMQDWARSNPQRWSHLLTQGLAYAAGDPPTYYYSLFKTVDGNMRTYVRGGGPAYAAGMRTNDIVDKVDGKYWWEYGTYQTQARAYDGKPHSFEVERAGKTFEIQLGEPFAT